jgi:hypothetical protein
MLGQIQICHNPSAFYFIHCSCFDLSFNLGSCLKSAPLVGLFIFLVRVLAERG